jgi:hypothetical protein
MMLALRKRLSALFSWLARSRPRECESSSDWCLVGNIVEERLDGEEKKSRRGTKHFSPGTKVYCLPPQWGDGYESAVVIGLHRGSRRWVTIVMPTKNITNWRAKVIYKPAVLERLRAGYKRDRDGHCFKRQWTSKKEAESCAAAIRERYAKI